MAEEVMNVVEGLLESAEDDESCHMLKINGKSIDDYTKVEATKCTNAMPDATQSLSAYPAFTKLLNTHSSKILRIIHSFIEKQQVKGNIQMRDNEEQLELMLECNDVMLERVHLNLEYNRKFKT